MKATIATVASLAEVVHCGVAESDDFELSDPTGYSSSNSIPDNFYLNQNYPNPFNPTTNITYSIPVSGIVTMTVYNSLGQMMNVLVNEFQPAGTYKVDWRGNGSPSGVYFYQIKSQNFTKTMKMVLIK